MHCTRGSDLNYCYTSKEENSGRSDCWDGNGCVCVCACEKRVCVCVSAFASVRVGRRWIEKHSVKRSFRNTLPGWRWHGLVDWRALLDRGCRYQPGCLALGMARSSGRGLSGKWCFLRHFLSTMCVYFGSVRMLRMAKYSIKALTGQVEDQNGACTGVRLHSCVKGMLCFSWDNSHIKSNATSLMWKKNLAEFQL